MYKLRNILYLFSFNCPNKINQKYIDKVFGASFSVASTARIHFAAVGRRSFLQRHFEYFG